jgi:hypothetical protein
MTNRPKDGIARIPPSPVASCARAIHLRGAQEVSPGGRGAPRERD